MKQRVLITIHPDSLAAIDRALPPGESRSAFMVRAALTMAAGRIDVAQRAMLLRELADEMTERAGLVPCYHCNGLGETAGGDECHACSGHGEIVDTGAPL